MQALSPKAYNWCNKVKLFFILLSLFLAFTGCEDENGNNPAVEIEEGSWVIYSPLKWTHDGAPVSGTLFKVYSDGAGYALKLQCLEFADRMFREILNQFSLDDLDELRFPPENKSKINVYIDTNHGVN